MNKKDVKKLFKQRPDFESWIKQDPARVRLIRKKPAETKTLLTKWESVKNKKSLVPQLDFRRLSDKTKQMNERLNRMQSILEMMAENSDQKKLF